MITKCIIICVVSLTACRNISSPPMDIPTTPRDITITTENAITLVTLDSQVVATYLNSALITDTSRLLVRNFYNGRNYQYAWIDENGLTEHANMLWNLYQEFSEYALNAPRVDSSIYKSIDELKTDSTFQPTPEKKLEIELTLTKLFFDYAFAKYVGNVNPAELQWYIPRKKVNISALLDTLISTSDHLSNWEPLHPQYRLLKRKLLRYTLIAEEGGWDSLPVQSLMALHENHSDSAVTMLKKRLNLTSNYPSSDTSRVFTRALKDSIKVMQQQFGIKANGKISPEFVAELNVPVEKRMQQILINMERVRWLPRQPDSISILVNIPSFTLRILDRDVSVMQMNIVVGTEARKTVIFSDDLKYVVFSPYWNVPPSIVKREILPVLKQNPDYLAISNMEQIGTSNGLPIIRQLPGPDNALGKVKFLFPNNYNIYLHDTPAKSHFGRTVRAFSHGCVRVEKPYELAKFLLRGDSSWNDKSIRKAMNLGREKWITLRRPIPVFITYFTAWIDNYGRINFRKDIYGHDQRMTERLFTKDLE